MTCPVSRDAARHAEQAGLLEEMDAARASFIECRASELRQQAITRGHVRFDGDVWDLAQMLGPLEHQTEMQVFAAIYAALNGNTAAIVAVLNDELQRWCEDAADKEWQQQCRETNSRQKRAELIKID